MPDIIEKFPVTAHKSPVCGCLIAQWKRPKEKWREDKCGGPLKNDGAKPNSS